MDIKALQSITYGMYVVGCWSEGHPAGCVINTCFQVTSENPSLAICLNKKNHTLAAIKEHNRFSLSVIAEETDTSIIGTFGFRSARDIDKYSDFGYELIDGTPAVKGEFCARLVIDAFEFIDAGTHEIVLGRLVDSYAGTGKPMTYAYYHDVVKGRAPKNAPTYVAGEKSAAAPSKERYRCDICGYVVETETGLPDDYICPVCGADRSHFKKIS